MWKAFKTKICAIVCSLSYCAEKILTRSQKVEVGREKRVETKSKYEWYDDEEWEKKQDWNGSF